MNFSNMLASAGINNNDLFAEEWTQGDLSKIAPLVRIGSMLSVWVLSIVGFGIIISVLFRYSMGALVATNPKLCHKIDEVHRMKAAQMLGTVTNAQGNELTAIVGFIPMLICSILPNVIALSDFEDETLDVKTFFTRGLPQACIFLFIGAFVFYGYTTKIGSKFTLFSTTLIDIFFLQTDPVAWAEAIPTKFVKYNMTTDNAIDYRNQQINKVAVNAAKTYFGRLTDVTKEARPSTALNIENWVMEEMATVTPWLDENKWSLAFTSATQIGEKDMSRYNAETATQKTYAFQAPLSQFNSGSVMEEVNTHWLRVELIFTAIAEKPTNKSIDSRLEGGTLSVNANKGYTIDLGVLKSEGASLSFSNSSDCWINKEKFTYSVENQSGSTVIHITGSSMPNFMKKNPSLTSLDVDLTATYAIGNFTSAISGISTDKSKVGNNIEFKSTNSTSGISSWTFGEDPSLKGDGSNSEDGEDNEEDNEENGDEAEDETLDSGDIFN